MGHGLLALGLGGLLLVGGCGGAGAPRVTLDPLRAVPPGGAALTELAFLSGCWRGSFAGGAGIIEERWTPPAGQMMLSNTRFLRDARVVDFEFGTLVSEEGRWCSPPIPGASARPTPSA